MSGGPPSWVLAPGVRRVEAGRVLIGGSPTTLMRLSAAGASALDAALASPAAPPTSHASPRDRSPRATDAPPAEPAGHPKPLGAAVVQLLARLERRGLLIAIPPPFAQAEARALLDHLTVVVPVRDDAGGLSGLLESLVEAERAVAGDAPSVDESAERLASFGSLVATRCVVVDDGSVDGGQIGDVAARWGAELIRRPSSGGPGAARMTGLEAVTTLLVAFLDADVTVRPDWLAAVGAHFDDLEVGADSSRLALVTPRVAADVATQIESHRLLAASTTETVALAAHNDDELPAARRRWGSKTIERYEEHHSSLDLGSMGGPIAPGTRLAYAPSAAWVARTEAIRDVGGFDPDLRYGEDVDLIWRLVEAGWTARYEPRSVVRHRSRASATAWAEQRFRYGTSAAPLAVRHPGALAPVVVSPWSLGAWLAVACGQRMLGLTVAAGSTAALARRLNVANPVAEALRLAGRGHLMAGPQLARGLIRPWWPITMTLALGSTRWRRLALVGIVASAGNGWAQTRRRLRDRADGGDVPGVPESELPSQLSHGPTSWVARLRPFAADAVMSVADDVAYSAGVWRGIGVELRHRPATRRHAIGALLPKIGGGRGGSGRDGPVGTGERWAKRLRSASARRGETL